MCECRHCAAVLASDDNEENRASRPEHPQQWNYSVCKCEHCRNKHMSGVCGCNKCIKRLSQSTVPKEVNDVVVAAKQLAATAVTCGDVVSSFQVVRAAVDEVALVVSTEGGISPPYGPCGDGTVWYTPYGQFDTGRIVRWFLDQVHPRWDSESPEQDVTIVHVIHGQAMAIYPPTYFSDIEQFESYARLYEDDFYHLVWYQLDRYQRLRRILGHPREECRNHPPVYLTEFEDKYYRGGIVSGRGISLMQCGDVEPNPGPPLIEEYPEPPREGGDIFAVLWSIFHLCVEVCADLLSECAVGMIYITRCKRLWKTLMYLAITWYPAQYVKSLASHCYGKILDIKDVVVDFLPHVPDFVMEKWYPLTENQQLKMENQLLQQQILAMQQQLEQLTNANSVLVNIVVTAQKHYEDALQLVHNIEWVDVCKWFVLALLALWVATILSMILWYLVQASFVKCKRAVRAWLPPTRDMMREKVATWLASMDAKSLKCYSLYFCQDLLRHGEKPLPMGFARHQKCNMCWELACMWEGINSQVAKQPNETLENNHACTLQLREYHTPLLAIYYVYYIRQARTKGIIKCWSKFSMSRIFAPWNIFGKTVEQRFESIAHETWVQVETRQKGNRDKRATFAGAVVDEEVQHVQDPDGYNGDNEQRSSGDGRKVNFDFGVVDYGDNGYTATSSTDDGNAAFSNMKSRKKRLVQEAKRNDLRKADLSVVKKWLGKYFSVWEEVWNDEITECMHSGAIGGYTIPELVDTMRPDMNSIGLNTRTDYSEIVRYFTNRINTLMRCAGCPPEERNASRGRHEADVQHPEQVVLHDEHDGFSFVSPEKAAKHVEEVQQQNQKETEQRMQQEKCHNVTLENGTMEQTIQKLQQQLDLVAKEIEAKKRGVTVKPKARAKPTAVKAESAVAGSKPVSTLSFGYASLTHKADGESKWTTYANVYLTAGTSNLLYIGAPRHRYSEETGAIVDATLSVDDVIELVRPNSTHHLLYVKYVHAHAGDEVWYATDRPARAEVPLLKFVSEEELGDLHARVRDGELVSVNTMYYKEGWHTISGPLVNCINADKIAYRFSTSNGVCRSGVFLPDGRLLAGHYDGRGVGAVPNGSLCRRPPANLKDWKVQPFNKAYYQLADVQGPLQEMEPSGPSYTVDTKVWPLRRDWGNMAGVATKHFLMRPGTELNAKELGKFGETPSNDGRVHDTPLIMDLVHLYDFHCGRTFDRPTLEKCAMITEKLGKLEKSAGVEYAGTQRQMCEELGEGDFQRGVEIVAQEVYDLYQYLEAVPKPAGVGTYFAPPGPGNALKTSKERIEELITSCRFWSVFGKKDGYKATKLSVGRTIQAPVFHLKVLWVVCFGDNDDLWISLMRRGRAAWVFAGHDFDAPVSTARMQMYARAKACVCLDMTSFDRRMPAWVIKKFFFEYLPRLNTGVPYGLMTFLCSVTIFSFLRLSDGRTFMKDQGNPSGFMNTIRLNCFVTLYYWLMCLNSLCELPQDAEAAKSCLQTFFHLEVCGDDSRLWILSKTIAEHMGQQGDVFVDFWRKHFPWEVKLEGVTFFDLSMPLWQRLMQAPGMVSRNFTPLCLAARWYMFEPLCNVSRAMKRLVHEETRSHMLERELVISMASTCALLFYAVDQGYMRSATVEAAMQLLWSNDFRVLVHRRVYTVCVGCLGHVAPCM